MQLFIALPQSSALPLYKQISDALRDAILTGRILPGKKMPSTRYLEAELRVSRLTVCRAIDDLASQGYVKTVAGSGSYVSTQVWHETTDFSPPDSVNPLEPIAIDAMTAAVSRFAKKVSQFTTSADAYASFCQTNCDNRLAPAEGWARMINKALRLDALDHSGADPNALTAAGYAPLKAAIAAFVGRARSIKCDPSQVVIFSSMNGSNDLILRLLTDEGESIAVENPGSIDFRDTVEVQGKRCVPVPLDEGGLIVSELERSSQKIPLVYVTSAHQVPTGVTMSNHRRQELLKWANSNDAWILEDDIDCEYRYGEQAVPAIASFDENSRVIYKSSFKSALYPLVRFGFIVVPRRLAPVFAKAKFLTECEIPQLEQQALTRFILEGNLERHIRRSQSIYSLRRAAMIHALTKNFGSSITIAKQSGALHVIVQFPDHMQSDLILSCAKQHGIPLVSASAFYVFGSPKNQYLIGFANSDEKEIAANVAEFAASLTSAQDAPPLESSADAASVGNFVCDTEKLLSNLLVNYFE